MAFDINVFANRLKELFVNSPLFPNMPENYVKAIEKNTKVECHWN